MAPVSGREAVEETDLLDFWRDRLARVTGDVPLPTDRPYTGVPSRAVTFRQVSEPYEDTAVLAGYAVLLSRYAGVTDLTIGVGSVPVGLDLSGDPSFASVVEQVRTAHDEALAHEVPLNELVSELRPAPTRGGADLFNTGFGTDLPLDLALTVAGARLAATYRADLFDAATVDRMLAHLEVLLADGQARPGRPVGRLELLSPGERDRVLVEWNDTDRAEARRTLPELFAEQVRLRPDSVAVVFESDSLTYAELDERANRLAHLLIGQGAGPERVVALSVPRSLDMIVAELAVLKSGAAYLPLDPDLPTERREFMLADASPVCVVTTVDEDELTAASPAAPDVTIGPDNAAYVIYTSDRKSVV